MLKTKPYLMPDEYLAFEREAEYKSEYFAGQTFAMAGASRRHNLIVGNMVSELSFQLKGRTCEVYSNDMRVKISATGLYTYPDIAVVCEDIRFEDNHEDTLLNPTVIIEVLSQSTQGYDRGEKFAHYRSLESLCEYLLIAQKIYLVEHYIRQPDNKWLLSETRHLQDRIELPSVSCTLALADIYDKVKTDV